MRGEAQRDAAGPAAQVLGEVDLHVRPQPPARLAPDEQLARAEDPVQRQEHALGVAAGRLGGPGDLARELPGAQKQPLPPAGAAQVRQQEGERDLAPHVAHPWRPARAPARASRP